MNKQEQLLSTALKLFVENGFHATPTSQIAREAGVATGTLFHHFKSKEALILALYHRIKLQMNMQIQDSIDPEANPREKLKSLYVNTLSWESAYPDMSHFIRQFSVSPFTALIDPEEIRQEEKQQTEFLNAIIKPSNFKSLTPGLLSLLIKNHIHSVAEYLANIDADEVQRNVVALESFELLWNMLNTKTDRSVGL